MTTQVDAVASAVRKASVSGKRSHPRRTRMSREALSAETLSGENEYDAARRIRGRRGNGTRCAGPPDISGAPVDTLRQLREVFFVPAQKVKGFFTVN
ncbi:hypothetical protein GCM10017776_46090 [Streptomyces griseoluteus]|nr:hypothetical protein GCM10017776_46090 [Streptomyces griseoluteus]